MNVPTSVSVVFAVTTYFLFQSGHGSLAWCVIVGGALAIGVVYGPKRQK